MEYDACPTPEPFWASISSTLYLTWLFYLTFVGRIIFAPLMPTIEDELGISHAQAGSLFLMISIGLSTAPFFAGLLCSKIKHRGSLVVSNLVVGIALILFSLFESLYSLRILMIVLGLAGGLHLPSAMATITAQVRREDWGKALGVHQSAPPLSFISAPIFIAIFISMISWQQILVTLGILSILSSVITFGFTRGGDFPGKPLSLSTVREIISKPSFWIMVSLFAMAMGGTAGIYSMLPLYLVSEHGMSQSFANTIIGISQISGLFIVFIAGFISDKIGVKVTIALALSCSGVMTILIGLLSGRWIVLAIFLQPPLVTSFFPSAFAAISRIVAPDMRSVANALGTSTAFFIGGGIIPTFLGFMAQTYSFASGIIIAGCFMLIGPFIVKLVDISRYDDEEGC